MPSARAHAPCFKEQRESGGHVTLGVLSGMARNALAEDAFVALAVKRQFSRERPKRQNSKDLPKAQQQSNSSEESQVGGSQPVLETTRGLRPVGQQFEKLDSLSRRAKSGREGSREKC